MPQTNIEQVISSICSKGLVPVFYHDDEEICIEIVSACYRAGLRVFEFTNRGKNGLANFKVLKQHIHKSCLGMVLGAGTIFNYRTALEFIDAGAQFIVSPAFIPSMVQVQSAGTTLWIPGCATVSELAQARELGVGMMKIFPGDLLGPKFAKAALSVMPTLKLMPTGGVEPSVESISAWLGSGVSAMGMGSQLFSKDFIEQKNWSGIEEKIRQTLAIVHELRNVK